MDRLLHMLSANKNVGGSFEVVFTKQKYLLAVHLLNSLKSMAYHMMVCCYMFSTYNAGVLTIPGTYY